MKIAFIVPTDLASYNANDWSLNLVPELLRLRHQVVVNDCSEDCDVLFAIERTMTSYTMKLHKKYPKVPLIVNNWDWYNYIDKTKGTYPEFIQLLKEAKDVWSGDMDTAKTTEKDIGVKSSFPLYIFILPWEWKGEIKDYGYTMFGSRQDPNKRFNWYEGATDELEIPFKSYHPDSNSRKDYIMTLKNCSFYVTASRETGVSIPDAEAAYCKKPILSPDNPGCREMWGNNATYFKTNDYEDFKAKIKWLWENYKSEKIQKKVEKCYEIVNKRFLPRVMAERIDKRLREVL